MTLQELEKDLIIKALTKTNGNMSKSMKILYPTYKRSYRSFLDTVRKKYNINPEDFK